MREDAEYKILFVKEKIDFVYKKVFYFYFGWNTLFKGCKKFKNIILFVNYIKFDS